MMIFLTFAFFLIAVLCAFLAGFWTGIAEGLLRTNLALRIVNVNSLADNDRFTAACIILCAVCFLVGMWIVTWGLS